MSQYTQETDDNKDKSPPSSQGSRNSSVGTGTIMERRVSAQVTGPVDFSELPGLPRLRYNALESPIKLTVIVFLLVLEASILPIVLYYPLRYDSTLRKGLIFAIITSFFGIVSGLEFGLRCLKLILKGDKYRPNGGRKWTFDFTHHTLSVGYFYMSGILIGFSIPHNPWVRPLAMPVACFLVQMGVQLVWSGWMNKSKRPAPFMISSVPKGGRVPPFVLTAVEDIVGVDGDGGREYRNALWARYEASPRFRRMIAQQNWFWAIGALIDGIVTLVVIWLPMIPEEVAYGVGKSH